MAFLRPIGSAEQAARTAQQGDTFADVRNVITVNATTAQTLSGAAIVAGILTRTGTLGGATNDTLPSAEQLIYALTQDFAKRPATGEQFCFRYINSATTQTVTLVAGTGVTISGTATVANNTWREYLVEFLSTLPSQVWLANTTNGSATVTFPASQAIQWGQLEVGMTVTGTGIAASTTVIGINAAGNSLTLSANATATNSNVSLTFGPAVQYTNIGAGTA